MNILFISKDLGQITLACKLAREDHAVKVHEIENTFKGKLRRPLIQFVSDWKKELSWVGERGLIVFDYTGMGKTQDNLRKQGLSVFGGCELGDRLENNRQYGQKIFSLVGMKVKQSIDFYNIDNVVKFVGKNKKKWAIKQNGHLDKGLNYIGKLETGEDVISVLKNYRKNLKTKKIHLDLQEKIDGIEIAAGRFFDGTEWAGPICLNIEHKNLFNDDLGPKTHEMGNLMWYEENENNKLFKETLAKMKKYLKRANFKGYFDVNCIVDKDAAYPLEATARFGQPTAQIQTTIQNSPWGEFMKAVADGKEFNLKYKKGYAIVVFLGTPPYPYANRSNFNSPKDLEILFKEKISKEEMENIYFEEASIFNKKDRIKYVICGKSGYIAHVAGMGKTVAEAREKTYKLINKIVIPKMFYRTDIGLKFIQEDQAKLRKWGWI